MTNRETLTISMPPKLLKEVRETARQTGMTQSEFLRNAARHFLVEKERVPGVRDLAKKLSPAERETLEIVFDKQAYRQIVRSFGEEKLGKLEPIESILK